MTTTAVTACLTVWARTAHALRTIAATHRLDLCFGSIKRQDGGFCFDAFLDQSRAAQLAEKLASEGFRCVITATHEEEPEVSQGNRYLHDIPRGVGLKR